MPLRALARVNLAAIERNVARLRGGLSAGTRMAAVVKADASGHGAVPTARASLAGGATMLAVAAWSEGFVADLAAAQVPVKVHIKLGTGLGRLGTRDRKAALDVAERVLAGPPGLQLAGAMTHFATADGDPEFLAVQLDAFRPFVAQLRRRVPELVAHAANSAATLREPCSHFDLVRCGIAVYGCDPMNEDPAPYGLEPALALTSYVAAVKLARPGDSAGYGRRFVAERDTWIATLPIGYGDGIRRGLSDNCDVLIAGRRYPLVGTVSMDNITVALGGEASAAVGAPATIIGRDGAQRQSVEDLANRIATVAHEILCGISARVPREYHRDGELER